MTAAADGGVPAAVALPAPASVGPLGASRPRFGRMASLLHRNHRAEACVLRFGDLTLDLDTREVRRSRRRIELTPTEFALLELFLRNPRRVLGRSFIFTNVWGFDFGAMSNSLNVYVGYLRRQTEAAGEPRLLHTVRGIGYVLREPSARVHSAARAGSERILRRLL